MVATYLPMPHDGNGLTRVSGTGAIARITSFPTCVLLYLSP